MGIHCAHQHWNRDTDVNNEKAANAVLYRIQHIPNHHSERISWRVNWKSFQIKLSTWTRSQENTQPINCLLCHIVCTRTGTRITFVCSAYGVPHTDTEIAICCRCIQLIRTHNTLCDARPCVCTVCLRIVIVVNEQSWHYLLNLYKRIGCIIIDDACFSFIEQEG